MTWIGKQAAFYRGCLPRRPQPGPPDSPSFDDARAVAARLPRRRRGRGPPRRGALGRVASVTFIRADPARYRPHFPALLCKPRTIEVASYRTHTSKRQETQARSRLAN